MRKSTNLGRLCNKDRTQGTHWETLGFAEFDGARVVGVVRDGTSAYYARF